MSYLNGKERIELLRVLNKLPTHTFHKLLTTINAPQVLSAYESLTLLKWVESHHGCGVEKFLTALEKVALVGPALKTDMDALKSSSQYSFPSEKLYTDTGKVNRSIASALPTHSQNKSSLSKLRTNGQRGAQKIFADRQRGKTKRIQQKAKSYQQSLGALASLEMVYIPGGSFWMGSSEETAQCNKEEQPQHKVKVPAFYMSKYPVTQQQWYSVSLLDDVARELTPYPSHFKGDDLPVENVSWHDAVEFCQRLSRFTGNEYCLPSEAEWEYACRAGTTTSFYFGETIATDHANYNGLYIYDQGKKGVYREKTTPVDLFLPNSFGLHDMYGNVWEWCQDSWHENYINAPKNNLPWLQGGNLKYRILRGGCWYGLPEFCRSAFRFFSLPTYKDNIVGMRVICRSS